MRILLTSHLPLGEQPGGAETMRLVRGLTRLGHQVRCLMAVEAGKPDAEADARVRRVPMGDDPSADVRFGPPRFRPTPGGVLLSGLSDAQIAEYREALRRQLDAEVGEGDPQVIHAQHASILAHLALESGVPYVVSAWADELDLAEADPRYRRFLEESTENAWRILAPDESVARRLPQGARRRAGRIVVSPLHEEGDAAFASRIADLYLAVLEAWFGA